MTFIMTRSIRRMRILLTLAILTIQMHYSWGQEISIVQKRVQIPVIKYRSSTPVLQFKINSNKKASLKKVVVDFEGTTALSDIDSVFLISMGQDSAHGMRMEEV